jgi:mono/diheme cytochrome c family protein
VLSHFLRRTGGHFVGKCSRLAAAGIVCGAGLLLAAAPTRAAEEPFEPSPDRGLALASKFCKECHVVESGSTSVVPAGPPTFNAIATRPDQTVERMRNVLINPHPPMPDMSLSNSEILDLIAYVDKLRTDAGKPAMLPPPDKKKPKHPSPS